MAKKRFFQKIKELETKKDSSRTENSAYWEYTHSRSSSAEFREHILSNPDVLPETEIVAPSTPQLLMGEAVTHLQGRQKEVYLLTMREGKSLAEAAEVLGISKGTAQKFKERAIKFLTQYCRAAIANGRV